MDRPSYCPGCRARTGGDTFTSISSAGIPPIEGITAFNAEGLAVSVHQNFSKSINARGRSIISITNEIAACARNISEAIEIISRCPSTSGWSILVGSAAHKEAAIIETNADGYEVTFPPKTANPGSVMPTITCIPPGCKRTSMFRAMLCWNTIMPACSGCAGCWKKTPVPLPPLS